MTKNWFSGLLFMLAIAFALAAGAPASAQVLYTNGPINGETDAWTINFGYVVNDSFNITSATGTISGLSFGAWISPGDTVPSVEVVIATEPSGGTVYYDEQVNLVQSGCYLNNYSYDVCTETASFHGPTLNNGMYWISLQNAVSAGGNPVYWDENSGPSEACGSSCLGTIPSESFTIFGNGSTTGTTPEPSSLVLLSSGLLGAVGILRRKNA